MSPADRERRGGVTGPQPLREVLDRWTRGAGIGAAVTATTVFERWADLVGDVVAAHVRPVELRGGVLVVEVADHAWASQLRWLRADLLAALARELGPGEVVDLVVRHPGGRRSASP